MVFREALKLSDHASSQPCQLWRTFSTNSSAKYHTQGLAQFHSLPSPAALLSVYFLVTVPNTVPEQPFGSRCPFSLVSCHSALRPFLLSSCSGASSSQHEFTAVWNLLLLLCMPASPCPIPCCSCKRLTVTWYPIASSLPHCPISIKAFPGPKIIFISYFTFLSWFLPQ